MNPLPAILVAAEPFNSAQIPSENLDKKKVL